MKHLLILDHNRLLFEYDLAEDLGIQVECVASISEAIRKQLFSTWSSDKAESGYDLLIIGISSEADVEVLDFTRYVMRNKPQLPLILFSCVGKELLKTLHLGFPGSYIPLITDKMDIWEILNSFRMKGIQSKNTHNSKPIN